MESMARCKTLCKPFLPIARLIPVDLAGSDAGREADLVADDDNLPDPVTDRVHVTPPPLPLTHG